MADEAIQRGIVKSISSSQVNRYLAEADLQPHRSKYWLNTTEKDPEVFGKQVQTVCNTYFCLSEDLHSIFSEFLSRLVELGHCGR